jgi:hypothetical protein
MSNCTVRLSRRDNARTIDDERAFLKICDARAETVDTEPEPKEHIVDGLTNSLLPDSLS